MKNNIKYNDLGKEVGILTYELVFMPEKDPELEKIIQRVYRQLKKTPILCETFNDLIRTSLPCGGESKYYLDYATERLSHISYENNDLVRRIGLRFIEKHKEHEHILVYQQYYARESRLTN